MKRVVIDMNVLLVFIFEKFKFYWIFKFFIEKVFEFCVLIDILVEYVEII